MVEKQSILALEVCKGFAPVISVGDTHFINQFLKATVLAREYI